MSVLNRKVLVLNKAWQPIRVETFRNSLLKVMKNRAKFIDHESFTMYSWEDWIDNFTVSSEKKIDGAYIKGVRFNVRMPEVVICTEYDKVPKRDLKLTRKNLLIRDKWKCQYTGKKLKTNESTIDHILPRSRGGGNSWDNLVICDIEVNVRKGSRTPEEAGLKLLSKPKKPRWNPIFFLYQKNIPDAWKKFINFDEINELGEWEDNIDKS